MHEQEAASGPYHKLIGPEILAQHYPLDRRLYGLWRCSDGREILFNRGYRPLWERRPGQPVKMANPKEWVDFDTETFFWTDGRGTNARGLRLLREWGSRETGPPSCWGEAGQPSEAEAIGILLRRALETEGKL